MNSPPKKNGLGGGRFPCPSMVTLFVFCFFLFSFVFFPLPFSFLARRSSSSGKSDHSYMEPALSPPIKSPTTPSAPNPLANNPFLAPEPPPRISAPTSPIEDEFGELEHE